MPPSDEGGVDSGSDVAEGSIADSVASDAESSPNAPHAVFFRDRDPRPGFVEGTITVERAGDESTLDAYSLYWTDVAGAWLGDVGMLSRSTTPLTLVLAAGTLSPPGATLLAATGWRGGNRSTPVTVKGDNAPVHVDIGADAGSDYLLDARAIIDTTNQKLLIVGQDASTRPTLRRCALDGTQCTAAVIDAGRGPQSGNFASPAIDLLGKKLLVVTQDGTNDGRAALFRCNLDGTACAYTDISAGQPASSGHQPVALVDAVENKLLVVTQNDAVAKLGFFRCELDGTACVYRDISAGQGPTSGQQPSAALDTANGKLVVVTKGVGGKSSLFRCATDGTACTYTDISAGGSVLSGSAPSVAIDAVGGKLLVVTQDDSNSMSPRHLAFVRCEIDGSACVRSELGGANTGLSPHILVRNTEMLVLSTDSSVFLPKLRRCALDGTGCTVANLSTAPANDGSDPSMVLDAMTGTLLVAGTANDGTPVLFRHPFDGSPITRHDLSAGPGSNTGFSPSALQDSSGALLIVTGAQIRNVPRLLLMRCGADGSGCTSVDLSTGNDRHAASAHTALLEGTAAKLLVVFDDPDNGGRPSMLRCEPNGTSCVYADLSAGAPSQTGTSLTATIDAPSGKLLVVGAGTGSSLRPVLFRCSLDGTGCTFKDLFPGGGVLGAPRNILVANDKLTFLVNGTGGSTFVQCALDGTQCVSHGTGGGDAPYAILDGSTLVVVGTNTSGGGGPQLQRCALDGTACITTNLTAEGHTMKGAATPCIDTVAKKLLVIQPFDSALAGPTLLRCELDGTGCLFVDLATGQGRWSGSSPRPLFDATRDRLLVVATNGANLMRPGLYMLDGW